MYSFLHNWNGSFDLWPTSPHPCPKSQRRYHFTLARRAVIKKMKDNRFWWGGGEEEPYILLVGINISTAAMESNMEASQKFKNGTTIWSSHLTSGYRSKGSEIRRQTRALTLTAALFSIAKIWKLPNYLLTNINVLHFLYYTYKCMCVCVVVCVCVYNMRNPERREGGEYQRRKGIGIRTNEEKQITYCVKWIIYSLLLAFLNVGESYSLWFTLSTEMKSNLVISLSFTYRAGRKYQILVFPIFPKQTYASRGVLWFFSEQTAMKTSTKAALTLHCCCSGPLMVSSAEGAQGQIIWAVENPVHILPENI